jgi:hypothetical protein
MREFDPTRPALVHDRLNDGLFEWLPEQYRAHFEHHGRPDGDGVIVWDGLHLDGWKPVANDL